MTDRTWLAVFATLAHVFILSKPYDAKGAFMLLHGMDVMLEGCDFRGSFVAKRSHIAAALDAERPHLEAARRSMIRVAIELERLRKTEA